MEAGTSTTGGGAGQSRDPEEVEKAKRRELITSAAAIAFGAGLDEPVQNILSAADEPTVPSRIRPGDVAQLQYAIDTVRASGRRAGGGVVRHQAVSALRWATSRLESSCPPTLRRDLAAKTADLASLAVCYTRDSGRADSARRLSLLGLQAAREADDVSMLLVQLALTAQEP